MIKKLALILALFLATETFAQNEVLNSITENELQAHLGFLSSDLLQGRTFYTKADGIGIAAEYIKSEIKQMGLKPGFDNYLQAVPLSSVAADEKQTYIEITKPSGEIVKNHSVCSNVMSVSDAVLDGEVVFAGYGWADRESGYDDLNGLDLKDKIVLIMTRNPKSAADKTNQALSDRDEIRKLNPVFSAGAKAVIFVIDPMIEDAVSFSSLKLRMSHGRMSLASETRSSPSVSKYCFVDSSVANQILQGQNTTIAQLQKKINESGKPGSFLIPGVKVSIHLKNIQETIEGANVVGFIEGSDPALKNECVVLTAHYDHMGVDSKNQVYNGADDNGSGSVALLEVADAISKMKNKPDRSIVFAWVTAEEKGLLGSRYYTQNPLFPLYKTAACINFDMVGRVNTESTVAPPSDSEDLLGKDFMYLIFGNDSTQIEKIANDACKEIGIKPIHSTARLFLSGSDHYHFFRNNVPIMGVSTGIHDDYHKVTDDIGKIDFGKIKKAAELGFLVATKVASDKTPIQRNK